MEQNKQKGAKVLADLTVTKATPKVAEVKKDPAMAEPKSVTEEKERKEK